MISSAAPANACPHCGMIHETTCPRIKAIEYHADGVTVRRVEFHDPAGEPSLFKRVFGRDA